MVRFNRLMVSPAIRITCCSGLASGRLGSTASSGQCLYPGDDLPHVKGLCHIIIGTKLQPEHLIHNIVLHRQQQNGRARRSPSLRQTSYPLSFGIMTSSTITSGSNDPTRSSASCPSPAVSTVYPSLRAHADTDLIIYNKYLGHRRYDSFTGRLHIC